MLFAAIAEYLQYLLETRSLSAHGAGGIFFIKFDKI
jgi:hypothetical protein